MLNINVEFLFNNLDISSVPFKGFLYVELHLRNKPHQYLQYSF